MEMHPFSNTACCAGAEPATRAGALRQRLEALVSDVSKWVRPVARHSLGPFLATLRPEDISSGEPSLFSCTPYHSCSKDSHQVKPCLAGCFRNVDVCRCRCIWSCLSCGWVFERPVNMPIPGYLHSRLPCLLAELLGHFTDTAGARGEDATALQVACACNLPEVAAAVGPSRCAVSHRAHSQQLTACHVSTFCQVFPPA